MSFSTLPARFSTLTPFLRTLVTLVERTGAYRSFTFGEVTFGEGGDTRPNSPVPGPSTAPAAPAAPSASTKPDVAPTVTASAPLVSFVGPVSPFSLFFSSASHRGY